VVFLGFNIFAKNVAQKSPVFAISPVSSSLQPHIWYTCPVGKVATVKGFVSCTEFGASTSGTFERITTDLAQWDLAGCNTANEEVFSLCRDRPFHFEITLNAGELIRTNQNAGDNATFLMIAEVVESPA